MSEWKEHDGKNYPGFIDGTYVVVRFPSGETAMPELAIWWHDEEDSNWVWPEDGPKEQHIVAYRIVEK